MNTSTWQYAWIAFVLKLMLYPHLAKNYRGGGGGVRWDLLRFQAFKLPLVAPLSRQTPRRDQESFSDKFLIKSFPHTTAARVLTHTWIAALNNDRNAERNGMFCNWVSFAPEGFMRASSVGWEKLLLLREERKLRKKFFLSISGNFWQDKIF